MKSAKEGPLFNSSVKEVGRRFGDARTVGVGVEVARHRQEMTVGMDATVRWGKLWIGRCRRCRKREVVRVVSGGGEGIVDRVSFFCCG